MCRKTGILFVEGEKQKVVRANQKVMQDNNIEHELLSGAQVKARFPELNYTDEHCVLHDPAATVLRANKCLRALQVLKEQLHFIV